MTISSILIATAFSILISLLFVIYMLYRNEKVHQYRKGLFKQYEVLSLTEYVQLGDYESLPSYKHMVSKFWVWPLDKFLTFDDLRKKDEA